MPTDEFLQELENDFIPFMNRLIEKEWKHYHWLEEISKKQPIAQSFMVETIKSIGHLTLRVEQYEEYIRKHKKQEKV